MSEITSILRFLGDVVYFIFDQSLNVVATGLLIASAAFPWRWGEIHHIAFGDGSDGWKSRCFLSFIITLLDCIAVPCLLCGILSPFRWFRVGDIAGKYLSGDKESFDNYVEYRGSAILTFIYVIVDFFTLPFIILILLSPVGRQFGLLGYFLTSHHCRKNIYDDDDNEQLQLNGIIVRYGIDSSIDFCTIFVVPAIVAVPSTWPSFCRIFMLIWKDRPKFITSPSQTTKSAYCESISDIHTVLRVWLVEHGILALLDCAAALPFLFAFVSPLRCRELMRLISSSSSTPSVPPVPSSDVGNIEAGHELDISEPMPGVAPSVLTVVAPAVRPRHDPKEPDYTLRTDIIRLGFLAMADLILYPMIFVLWATRYRYGCIAHLMTADNHWGIEELITVAKQFSCLLIDIFVFLVPFLFVFITRLRWEAIQRAIFDEETFKTKNIEFYCLVLKQAFYFIMDILTIPLLLIVLLSVYRFLPLIPVFYHRNAFCEGLKVNFTVLINAFVVLHDLIFVLPALLLMITVLGFARLHCLCYRYESSQAQHWEEVQRRQMRNSFANTVDNIAANLQIISLDEEITQSDCDFELRYHVWTNLCSAILDFPFIVLGAIVVATVWRSGTLLRNVRKIVEFHSLTGCLSMDKYYRLRQRILDCRKAAAKQFLYLLFDLLMIIPITFVLASVYRIPSLLMDLFALIVEAAAVLGLPIFDVTRVEITWKAATEPVIAVRVKPLSQSNENNDRASEVAQVIHEFSKSEYFQLTLVGDEIWKEASVHLGGMITNVVKSMLPLKLRLSKEDIGLIRTSSSAADHASISQMHINVVQDDVIHHGTKLGVDPSSIILAESISDIWIRLPLKDVKRSTVIKKLRLFNPAATLTFQVCGQVTELQFVPQQEGYVRDRKLKMTPLLYLSCTVQQLIQALGTSTATEANRAPVFPDETVLLTSNTMTLMDYRQMDAEARRLANSSSKVDRFSAIVGRHFALVLVDLLHLFLFCFILLSPWRMVQCLQRLFSDDRELYNLIGERVLLNVVESEYHLKRLRDIFVPILNRFAKSQYGMDAISYVDYRWANGNMGALEKKNKYEIEYHLRRYAELTKAAKYQMKTMQKLSLTNSDIVNDKLIDVQTMDDLLQLHSRLFYWLFARYSIWGVHPDGLGDVHPQHYEEKHQKYLLSSLVIVEEHDHVVDTMLRARRKIEQSLHARVEAPEKKSFLRQCCSRFRIHPTHQFIIRRMARRVVSDWAGIVLFVWLLITVVEFVPMLSSMYWRDPQVSPKSAMLFHARRLGSTLKQLARLIVCLSLLVISIVGLPHYIERVHEELRRDTTLEDMADIASQELRSVCDYLWELFCLVTAFKSYRILMKCVLYCLLLPGAVVADALGTVIGTSESSVSLRFTIGSGITAGVFVGALVVTNRKAISEDAAVNNNSLLSLLLVVIAVQASVGILSHYHPANQRRQEQARHNHEHSVGLKARSSMLRFQWDHVMGALLAPMECLCLSSVIMFFYWQAPGYTMAAQRDFTALNWSSMLEVDNLSRLLFWNTVDEPTGSSAMKTEVSLACFATIIWATLISIPLVQGGDTASYRYAKILSVLRHKTYRALVFGFGQFLGVWILATLMRPNSCVEVPNPSDPSDVIEVLSTQLTQPCGTNHGYDLGHAALPFGIYYLVSSAIVHPRFYEPPSETIANQVTEARTNPYRYADASDSAHIASILDLAQEAEFHPSYQLFIRIVQTLLCTLCFALVGVTPSVSILVPIFLLSVIVALLPLGLYLVSSCVYSRASSIEEQLQQLCTVPALVVFRSAAYAAIAWTTLVCIVRVSVRANDAESADRLSDITIFATEGTVYIGWAVIALVSIVSVYWTEVRKYQQWQELLNASGIADALSSMVKLYQLVSTEFYAHHVRSRRVASQQLRQQPTSSDTSTAATTAPVESDDEKWTRMVRYAIGGSLPGLVRLVMELEELVPIDRLSRDFLYIRKRWISCLTSILATNANVLDNDFVGSENERQVEFNYTTNTFTPNDDVWRSWLQRAREFHQIPSRPLAQLPPPPRSTSTPVDADVVTDIADVSVLTKGQLLDFYGTEDPSEAAAMATALEAGTSVAQEREHQHQQQQDFRDRQYDTTDAPGNHPSGRAPPLAAAVIPHRMSALLDLIAMLHFACHDAFSTTFVSRQVLATILSYRRIPREVSWIVFSYLLDLRHVRNILIYHTTAVDSALLLRRPGSPGSDDGQRESIHPDGDDSRDAQWAETVVRQGEQGRLETARRREALSHSMQGKQSRKNFVRDNVGSAASNLRVDMATIFKCSIEDLTGGHRSVYS
jgi:hypothetical protein